MLGLGALNNRSYVTDGGEDGGVVVVVAVIAQGECVFCFTKQATAATGDVQVPDNQ